MGRMRRVALVRDMQQMDPEEQKRLSVGLERIPPSGLLIPCNTGAPVIEDGKKKRSSIIGNETGKGDQKVPVKYVISPCPKVVSDDVRGLAIQAARALGKSLAPDAISLLATLPMEECRTDRTGDRQGGVLCRRCESDHCCRPGSGAIRGPDECDLQALRCGGDTKDPRMPLGYVSQLFRSGSRPESRQHTVLVLLARQIRLLAQFRYLGEKANGGTGVRLRQPRSPRPLTIRRCRK